MVRATRKPPRLLWITDVHLNALERIQREAFYGRLRAAKPDALLLGGDIGEGYSVARYLEELHRWVNFPVYFVLGNHDYYRSSFPRVRETVRNLADTSPNLVWLPAAGVVRLNADTALIGHGGWGDSRLGDFEGSEVRLNDYRLIAELAGLEGEPLRQQLRRLGDEAAAHLLRWGDEALRTYPKLIVLMHVPPFAEACWYEGTAGNPKWTPHFACGAAGEALATLAERYPAADIQVLCGHTHHGGEVNIRPNLCVLTASAEYGKPEFARQWELA